jgi:hypothetical protein
MKTLIAAMVGALAITSPAVAATAHSHGKTHASKHTVRHAAPVRTVRRVWVPAPQPGYVLVRPRAYSPNVYHPSYDAYVNGEYAGTDPDPLIRMQLRREYCQDSMDGCTF